MQATGIKKIQTGLVVIGVIIIILGMSLHFGVPSKINPSLVLTPDAGETTVDNIRFNRGIATYQFRLNVEIWSPRVDNCSISLLNSTEYERYLNGTPLESLESIFYITNTSTYLHESGLDSDLNVYLVFVNNNTYQVLWVYFYTIIPFTFFPSLILAFSGLLFALATLIWQFKGMKRYFFLGLFINTAVFFVRTLTLANAKLGVPWGVDYFLELYNDYTMFYVSWVGELWKGVWPYSAYFSGYIYPPLFIYTIAALGISAAWLPGLILFSFNMATGYLVYLIARHLKGDERWSIIAMLSYLLNPITLVYGSFLLLNPAPFVFFITLSFYLILKEQRTLTMVALAFATLNKQFTAIFFPLLIIYIIKSEKELGFLNKAKAFAKYTLAYFMVLLLVSVPFLLVDYETYISRTILSSTGYSIEFLTTFNPSTGYPVNFNTFFLLIGTPPIITIPIAFLLASYLLLGIPLILVYIIYARTKVEKEETGETKTRQLIINALFWSIIIVLLLQLFYPRGTYKFYLLAVTPFISILFDYNDLTLSHGEPFEFKRRHLFPVLMSLAVFLCLRYIYFWILIAWIIFLLKKRGYWTALTNYIKRNLLRQQSHTKENSKTVN